MEHLEYLLRTTVLITAGVVAANIVMETNLADGLSRPVGWLCRASNLSRGCMMSVLACTISPTAGKATLSEYYRCGQLDETETALALLMSTFPTVLGESLFRVQAPVAVVLLGPAVGGAYVMLNLFSSFIQSFGALTYSRLVYSGRTSGPIYPELRPTATPPAAGPDDGGLEGTGPDGGEGRRGDGVTEEPWKEGTERPGQGLQVDRTALAKGLERSIPALRRTLPVVVATMLLMNLLMGWGLIDFARTAFDPLLRLLGLPGDCIAPMVMQLVHFSAGYAAVAALLDAGSITESQALITLVAGSMAVITMIYVRYSLPMYLALFGRFGARLTATMYLASMVAKTLTLLLILLLF